MPSGIRGDLDTVDRNPPWQRDELILALDLYFKHNPLHISKNHAEVVALSKVPNALPIHADRPDAAKFRNPNGVYMKLCNFLPRDKSYTGAGLSRGNALEQKIWDEFAADKKALALAADAIKARLTSVSTVEKTSDAEDDEEEFPEGRVLFRAHRSRERNRTLVKKAKALALKKYGKLACEVCSFDFAARYGKLGTDYIECHHAVPISQIAPGTKTKVADLRLLCSNCHHMVHRRRPWLAVGEMKALLT
jgi:5-methylcytosine-specific restriction enzyme A